MNRKILKGIIFIGLFIIPFVPLFVSGALFFPFITTKVFAWRIIVEIIFAAWALLAYLDPVYRPKRSLILWCGLAFLVIIGLADLFGASPVKSFWSNFERMEGFVSLLHLGAFFLVISSIFKEREWKWWWNTSLAASALVVFYSLFQLAGKVAIHQGGARVDATFGNASYLAVYLLMHIFIAIFYLVRERQAMIRWVYGVLIALQVVILYETATRGAILGLLGGLLLIALLNVKNRESRIVRKLSLGGILAIVVLVGGFLLIRQASFVKNSSVLARFANISSAELKTEGRSFIWPMALQGIKEKPLLGWGQDNFNYIFDEHYSPKMFGLEPWFDRAHNIFLDWAVAGGLLGLLGYLSLYVALLLAIWKKDLILSHLERSIFTGLIAGYFFHNLFVFDNLLSYIFFIAILGYVHTHTAEPGREVLGNVEKRAKMVNILALPAAALLVLVLYFVNFAPLSANTNLIHALQSTQTQSSAGPVDALGYFEKAYNASRLGRPEVVEWVSTSADSILSGSLTTDQKNAYYDFAKTVVVKQADALATDARYQLLAGSFLSHTGALDDATIYLQKAEKLMPGKQVIYFEEGGVLLAKKDYQGALAVFKKAYDLAPEYEEADLVYLVGALYAGNKELARSLISTIPATDLIGDNRITTALYATGQYNDLIIILENRLNASPNDSQAYIDLAAAFAKAGMKTQAIAVLQALEKQLPATKAQVDQYIEAVQKGNI